MEFSSSQHTSLQELRAKYQPKLPRLLRDPFALRAKTEPLAIEASIQEQFPKLGSLPLVRAEAGTPTQGKAYRVGVVFSGGPAPGGHNVVTGLFDALQQGNAESRLIGFLDGQRGLLSQKFIELSAEKIAPFRNQGGFDLLGSGRDKIETKEQLEACRRSAEELSLDAIVIIGGDDSNTNAAVLAEYFLQKNSTTKVIGVPKTIDNDLQCPYIPLSFGFDTACGVYAEIIGNIARDALSTKKYYHFIKLMGRSASHITLECALRTHPNFTCISEEGKTLEQIVIEIADLVCERAKIGKPFGVILIPEGLIESLPQLCRPAASDPHGNIHLSSIETEKMLMQKTAEELAKRAFDGKFSPMAHFLGYEGRAAYPSDLDTHYCYALGRVAAFAIHQGLTGYLCAIPNVTTAPVAEWEVAAVPLLSLMHWEERKGQRKAVIRKTLVDLKAKPFQELQKGRAAWRLNDAYLFPGPIQYVECGLLLQPGRSQKQSTL